MSILKGIVHCKKTTICLPSCCSKPVFLSSDENERWYFKQTVFIHTVKARGPDFYSMDVKKEEYCQNIFFCFTQKKESHAQFEVTWRWVNYLFCSLNIMPGAMRTQIGLVLTSQQWHLTDTIFYMPPKQPYFLAPMIPEVFQNQSFISKHVITQRDYFLCSCKSYVLMPPSLFELKGSRQTQLIWSKT